MADSADPFNSWDLSEMLKVDSAPATHDLYGKLFHHLRDLFGTLHRRLLSSAWQLQLLNVDAKSLLAHLKPDAFARIEVRYLL